MFSAHDFVPKSQSQFHKFYSRDARTIITNLFRNCPLSISTKCLPAHTKNINIFVRSFLFFSLHEKIYVQERSQCISLQEKKKCAIYSMFNTFKTLSNRWHTHSTTSDSFVSFLIEHARTRFRCIRLFAGSAQQQQQNHTIECSRSFYYTHIQSASTAVAEKKLFTADTNFHFTFLLIVFQNSIVLLFIYLLAWSGPITYWMNYLLNVIIWIANSIRCCGMQNKWNKRSCFVLCVLCSNSKREVTPYNWMRILSHSYTHTC